MRVKWIKISEKLPELNKTILCCFETINHPCQGYRILMSSIYRKRDNCDIKYFEGETMYNKVTHWAKINFPG